MPAGDGVSLPTTLAQMGSVAKTQAKGQQTATQTVPFSDQLNKDDDLKVQRVKETDEATQRKIDANAEKPDKRKRRRLNRNRKQLSEESEEDQGAEKAGDQPESPELGVLIDMRV